MGDVACSACGSVNADEANFCSVCGTPLSRVDSTTETHAVVTVPGAGEPPVLVVVRGANAGSRFSLLDGVTTIGRHPNSAVFLDDVTVSRRHAEVHASAGGYDVVDVGSLNGTYVNGHRIDRSPLAEGDQIQIGKYRIVVVAGGHAGEVG